MVAVLCHYGFVVRGPQRLQIETLSDNDAMLRSAERNGFVREGVLRSSAWVMGWFLDEVLPGLLAQGWKPGRKSWRTVDGVRCRWSRHSLTSRNARGAEQKDRPREATCTLPTKIGGAVMSRTRAGLRPRGERDQNGSHHH